MQNSKTLALPVGAANTNRQLTPEIYAADFRAMVDRTLAPPVFTSAAGARVFAFCLPQIRMMNNALTLNLEPQTLTFLS